MVRDIYEGLKAELRKRDGEIDRLRSALSEAEKERETMADKYLAIAVKYNETVDRLIKTKAELAQARKALEPFSNMGLAFLKHGEADNSPWANTPDDLLLQVGANHQFGWHLRVGDLRTAALITDTGRTEGEQK